MINFMKRNLLVFFKDKASVFFSLLSVFIIIGMYALFLGDVWTSSMKDVTGARILMDCWIVAGLIAVITVVPALRDESQAETYLKELASEGVDRRDPPDDASDPAASSP